MVAGLTAVRRWRRSGRGLVRRFSEGQRNGGDGVWRKRGSGFVRLGVHTDLGTRLSAFEFDHPGGVCVERVVPPYPNVDPWKELGSPLADDDGPCFYQFPAVGFDPEILGVAVPAVSC